MERDRHRQTDGPVYEAWLLWHNMYVINDAEDEPGSGKHIGTVSFSIQMDIYITHTHTHTHTHKHICAFEISLPGYEYFM